MVNPGIITLWFGAIVNIPAGWVICDGTNGTPNLRDKFVIGAGLGFAVDDTGGFTTHNHTFTGDGHTHNINAGAGLLAGAGREAFTDSAAVTGSTGFAGNIPPFHALAYIMKT